MLKKETLIGLERAALIPCPMEQLTDITQIPVDAAQPAYRRIDRFVSQVGNPYAFRVGDTPVRVTFAQGGPPLSARLEEAAIRSP